MQFPVTPSSGLNVRIADHPLGNAYETYRAQYQMQYAQESYMTTESSGAAWLPQSLQDFKHEIELYCGFTLEIGHDPALSDRGVLDHSPESATIKVRAWPPPPAVVAHELCHAFRYFNQSVPFMQFAPPIYIKRGGGDSSPADVHLDNQLEHLVVYSCLKERFGFLPDPENIENDYRLARNGSEDELLQTSLLFCNWLLANYHFPEWVQKYADLMKRQGLCTRGEVLLREIEAAGSSKPRMVAALVRALEIHSDQVYLRVRNVEQRCDTGAPLSVWLADAG